jgi:hypothetical protein
VEEEKGPLQFHPISNQWINTLERRDESVAYANKEKFFFWGKE